jgi:DNA-binding transcriptional regulator of glucitol operon
MKLSQTEHKIKKNLSDREIQPSAELWDNIQSELDKSQKPKSKVLWFRLAGVAALLCLCFLAYQGFQNTRETIPTLVLQQKEAIEQPIEFNTQTIDYVVLTKPDEIEDNLVTTQKEDEPKAEIQETITEVLVVNQNNITIEDEVQSLLQNAKKNLAKKEQEKLLIAEVDNLLNEAIENTQDPDQENILKSMKARLLLAEVESEIELSKPPNLKDKIWEAIVSNYNDLKSSVAIN